MIEDAFTMSEEHIVTEFHKFAMEHNLDKEMADDILPAALAARLQLLREVEVIRTARVAIQENRATAGMLMAAVIAMEHMRQLVDPGAAFITASRNPITCLCANLCSNSSIFKPKNTWLKNHKSFWSIPTSA